MPHRLKLVIVIFAILVTSIGTWLLRSETTGLGTATVSHPLAVTPPVMAFNKHALSTTDPTSLWVIINKQHPLSPIAYIPPSLVVPNVPWRSSITSDERHVSSAMAPALEQLVNGAKQAGLILNLQSGYRSYSLQVSLYNSYVRRDGQAAADTYSARPGFSEHQTGLAADLGGVSKPACNVEQCFATTAEGQWLALHAYQYGFIIRYPDGEQAITGYEYEPWHVRYVGVALATEMYREHIDTLEQFFGINGGTAYGQS